VPLEQELRSVAAPSLLVLAALASFALAGQAPLSAHYSLALFREVCLISAGGLWLGLGLRHVRRRGAMLQTVLFPVAGVLVFLFVVAMSFSTLQLFESVAGLINEPDIDQVKETAAAVITDPESSPERRAWASHLRARMVFVRTGELLPILDASGNESVFQPTEQDHEQRLAEERMRVLAPYAAASSRRTIQIVGCAAVICLALGLATPVRRAPAA